MKHYCYYVIAVLLCAVLVSGCATMGQTGALTGGGIGALAGNLIGGNTVGTLIGAGIGTGVGYIIGNEMDKDKAKKMRDVPDEELQPLAGTVWQVTKVTPAPKDPIGSVVVRFNSDGNVTTTSTFDDGKVKKTTERYRIVGDTLIINEKGYVVNNKFSVSEDTMTLYTPLKSVTLQRI